MSALALPGLSPEPRSVDNRGISSRFQSRIATVNHITAYDLTNCTQSEPFVASLCGGLWSVLTLRLRQGPSSRYCPEIATAPGGSSRPAFHGTRLQPVGVLTPRRHSPPKSGGRPLLDTAKKLPQRHQVPPDLGPSPWHGARPWPMGFSHHGTSRRQTPTSAHARFRAGNGEERGRTQHARNPATLLLVNPQPHRVHPASVRGPRSCHRLEIATSPPGSTRLGPSPRHGARPRPVGVQSSRDLEAPDAHQCARMLYGPGCGRAGADPACLQPRHAPAC